MPRSGASATNCSAKATSARQVCHASATRPGSGRAGEVAVRLVGRTVKPGDVLAGHHPPEPVLLPPARWRTRPSRDRLEGGTDRHARPRLGRRDRSRPRGAASSQQHRRSGPSAPPVFILRCERIRVSGRRRTGRVFPPALAWRCAACGTLVVRRRPGTAARSASSTLLLPSSPQDDELLPSIWQRLMFQYQRCARRSSIDTGRQADVGPAGH
jgi:hypothetical protein